MKILIYSHFFAPSIGGVETVVSTLAQGLSELHTSDAKCEFEVTLVTSTPRGSFQENSLPYRVIRNPGADYLRRLITQVDVVHVAGPALLPILLGLLVRKPVIVEHHGFQTICPTGQMVREPEIEPCPGHFMAGEHSYCLRCSQQPRYLASFRLWLLTFVRRFLCRYVTLNITPTAWLARQLQLPHSETVPHGLPVVPYFVRSEVHDVPTLIFVGRLVTTKGLRILLDAVRILREQNCLCEVLIVGDGPDRTAMENHAQQAGISTQVHFLGRLSESQILETLGHANIVVAPSLGGEVFGMVLVENMLRGLPIVASDLGSYHEVLGDAGKTFRTGDASDLARQLSLILHDPLAPQRLGVVAKQRALELFNAETMIARHANIYRRVNLARTLV